MELLDKISHSLQALGHQRRSKVLKHFSHYPFVNGQFDFSLLHSMCMEEEELVRNNLENKKSIQEPPEAKEALKEKTRAVLSRLGEEEKRMILKECIDLPGLDVDYGFVYKKAMEELAKIRGENPVRDSPVARRRTPKIDNLYVFYDGNFVKEGENQSEGKLLHDSIKIGMKRPRTYKDAGFEQEKDRMKKTKSANVAVKNQGPAFDLNNAPPAALPRALEVFMANENGTDAVLVIQKRLSSTDVNPHNARLSLPLTQVNPGFLSHSETAFLFQEPAPGEKLPRIKANILEPCGTVRDIYLTKWNMKGAIYNLVTTWKDVVKNNSLKEDMEVQLWSFRAGSQFWFALLRVGDDEHA